MPSRFKEIVYFCLKVFFHNVTWVARIFNQMDDIVSSSILMIVKKPFLIPLKENHLNLLFSSEPLLYQKNFHRYWLEVNIRATDYAVCIQLNRSSIYHFIIKKSIAFIRNSLISRHFNHIQIIISISHEENAMPFLNQ